MNTSQSINDKSQNPADNTILNKDGRYILIAYRYGHKDGYSYLVDICGGIDTASERAEQEANERGGKYSISVFAVRLRGGVEEIYVAKCPKHYTQETTPTIDDVLKKCPFCDGDAELILRGNAFTKKRSAEIECNSCHTKQVTGAIHNSLKWCKEKAIEKWNKRNAASIHQCGGWTGKVLDWHNKFGVDVAEKPTMMQPTRFEMRQRILQEEVDELQDAFWMKDKGLTEVADAICDILYVIIGTAIEFGLHEKLNLLFSEVHRSNMSKLDEHGNPVRREDGKILKSKLWSPPNLESIIKT